MKDDRTGPGAPQILGEIPGLIALSKPPGLHVFGPDSLCSWLLAQRPALANVGPEREPAIVHRIDGGTSGLVLAAADASTYDALRSAFGGRSMQKDYLALVEGSLMDAVVVDLPLGARYRRSKRVWADTGARALRGVRPAHSEVDPLGSSGALTLCRVRIRTGVRHQIRAHLAHLGHPVLGDGLYGGPPLDAAAGAGFFLHAWRVRLPEELALAGREWRCPLPPERRQFLASRGLASALAAGTSG